MHPGSDVPPRYERRHEREPCDGRVYEPLDEFGGRPAQGENMFLVPSMRVLGQDVACEGLWPILDASIALKPGTSRRNHPPAAGQASSKLFRALEQHHTAALTRSRDRGKEASSAAPNYRKVGVQLPGSCFVGSVHLWSRPPPGPPAGRPTLSGRAFAQPMGTCQPQWGGRLGWPRRCASSGPIAGLRAVLDGNITPALRDTTGGSVLARLKWSTFPVVLFNGMWLL